MSEWSSLIHELVFSGMEDITVFSPELLVRLIAFMLMLEFMGGIFHVFAKLVKAGEK